MDDPRIEDAVRVRWRLLAVALASTVLSEILAFAGIGSGVHTALASVGRIGDPFFSACLLGSAVVYAAGEPDKRRRAWFLAIGIVGEVVQAILRGDAYFANAGATFGLVALAVRGWGAIRARHDRVAVLGFLEVAIFPALLLAAILPLELTVLLHPTSLDGRALRLDVTLFGGAPAWWTARAFAASRSLAAFERLVYVILPIAAAGVYVFERRARARSDVQVAFLAVGLVGIAVLHLTPVAGPNAFRPMFPSSIPDLDVAVQSTFIAGTRWRNSIPSMHTTWALFIYWHARAVGPYVRAAAAAFLVATIVAMLGLGEHYLVDVVITIPFAVAARAALLRSVPLRDRIATMAIGSALFALWLVVIRSPNAIISDPWIVRFLAVVTSAGAIGAEVRLSSRPVVVPPPLAPARVTRAAIPWAALGFGLALLPPGVAVVTGVGALIYGRLRLDSLVPAALGGAFGALVAAHVLLPSFGILMTAGVGVAFALIAAFFLYRTARTPAIDAGGALIPIALAGVTCAGLAVTYRHLLSLVAGNTAYAHASVTAVMLLGVATGAVFVSKLGSIAIAQGGLALAALVGIFGWAFVPSYFEDFAQFATARTFAISELVRFVAISAITLPPALFAGASLVYAGQRRHGAFVVAGGALVGVLTAALLIPWAGSARVIQIFIVVSAGALALGTGSKHRVLAVLLAGACILSPGTFDLTRLATGANVYFARQGYGNPVDHVETLSSWSTVSKERSGVLAVLAYGKFSGDNDPAGAQHAATELAAIAIAHGPAHHRALVYGVGTGTTATTLASAFESVRIVEESPGAASLARRNFGADLDRPNIAVTSRDLRSELEASRYDVIGLETSTAWFDGAGRYYSKELYELTKRHLAEHGVLQQWIQIHRVDRGELASMLATVRSVYARVWLYLVARQGVLIACADECQPPSRPELVLGPDGVTRFLASMPAVISTDDWPFLELQTARHNMEAYESTLRQNEALLRSYDVAER